MEKAPVGVNTGKAAESFEFTLKVNAPPNASPSTSSAAVVPANVVTSTKPSTNDAAAKKKVEDDAAAKKKAEDDAAAKKKAEDEAAAKKKAEDDAKKKVSEATPKK